MRAFMRANFKWAFESGILFMTFLEINGQKAAAYLAYDYLNRLWVYNSGINRDFMEYSPGWVFLGFLLRWCNEQKREAFDFMRGDEEYKYRFGAVDRFVMRLVLKP
jgi:CelD/BcsL family acetyltransferase involved in cellulose biosynthesis